MTKCYLKYCNFVKFYFIVAIVLKSTLFFFWSVSKANVNLFTDATRYRNWWSTSSNWGVSSCSDCSPTNRPGFYYCLLLRLMYVAAIEVVRDLFVDAVKAVLCDLFVNKSDNTNRMITMTVNFYIVTFTQSTGFCH